MIGIGGGFRIGLTPALQPPRSMISQRAVGWIRGGTVAHGDSPLCHTCRYATIVKGRTLRDEIIECANLTYGRGRITFPVTYCTSYSDRRQASLREMEEIAWILRSDPKRNDIGFVHASKLKERQRHVLYDDE